MTKNIQKMVHLATRVGYALFSLVSWIYSGKPRETKEICYAHIAVSADRIWSWIACLYFVTI